MNSQVKRLRTFFYADTVNVYDKNFITKKGFYLDQTNNLKCYKCKEVIRINQPQQTHLYLIAAHQCDHTIHSANVEIPSPYDDLKPNHWTDDLNYIEFRYATFANWTYKQSRVKRTTLQLAEAGFFYAAIPNTIVCFYCRTGIFADSCDVTCASDAIKKHDTNKKCEQKKCALQAQAQHKKSTQPLEENGPSSCQLSTPWADELAELYIQFQRTTEELARMMSDKKVNWEFDRYILDEINPVLPEPPMVFQASSTF